MIIVLDKESRDLLGVADSIKEAKSLRAGRESTTTTEVIGDLAYHTRYIRGVK